MKSSQNKKIQQVLEMEAVIKKLTAEIKSDIKKSVTNTTLKGVKNISKDPVVFVMKLSSIDKYGLNLSPDYYSSEKQANLVYSHLNNANDLTDLMSRINKLIEDKFVKTSNGKFSLNPETVEVLKQWAVTI